MKTLSKRAYTLKLQKRNKNKNMVTEVLDGNKSHKIYKKVINWE